MNGLWVSKNVEVAFNSINDLNRALTCFAYYYWIRNNTFESGNLNNEDTFLVLEDALFYNSKSQR